MALLIQQMLVSVSILSQESAAYPLIYLARRPGQAVHRIAASLE